MNHTFVASNFELELRELTGESQISSEAAKADLLEKVLEYVKRHFAADIWVHTEHGFNVSEMELDSVPPLKPGWKVAKFTKRLDVGDADGNPVVGTLYVAVPKGSLLYLPQYGGEVPVDDIQYMDFDLYPCVLNLPANSFIYQDGKWNPISYLAFEED